MIDMENELNDILNNRLLEISGSLREIERALWNIVSEMKGKG